MPNQNLAHRRAVWILTVVLLIGLMAGAVWAAPKTATQIPSIQAPPQPANPKTPAQVPSIQAPAQPSAPAGQPAANQTPGAQPAPQAVPVMVPVATTQRDLSPEVQKNLKLLTGQNFPLEARQIGAAGMLQQGSAAVSALRQILSSQPAPIVVQAVAMAIPEIKDPPAELIDPLVQQLCVEETEVRSAVIAALISYRDHDLPAKLRSVAANLQNPQAARLAAITVLNQLADRDSIETLIYLLDTPDDMVRQSSLNALGQMTGVNFGFEIAQWQRWWQTNRNRKPQEWAKPVIAALKEENRSALEEVKSLRDQLAKAQRELYYLSPELDRPKRIIYCLTHSVPDVRLVGVDLVNMLIPMMDRKSIPPEVADQLRKLINDLDSQVRLQSVRVLGDLRNPEDARLLLDTLKPETDPATREAIVRALGLLHNPAAIPVLLEKLNTGDAALAAAAAAGLSLLCQKTDRTASAEQVDLVVTALKARMESATDKALRQAILDAMARIADERFREQFLAALQSQQDPALRQSAVKAFADLDGPEDAEKVLAPQLADPETVVREAVCAALGKIGQPSQLALLLLHCDEQVEPNLTVRRAAEDAAISIMLRMDRPLLRAELDPLTATPSQVLALAGVLKKALVQVSQNPDSLLQKAAAAELWVKVVLLQPTDTAAIGMLAKVLVELGNAESLAGTVQQIAADQGSALAGVLTALGKEMQAARGTSQPGEVAQALRKIDTTSWPQPNQAALRSFIETCSGSTGTAGDKPTAGTNGTAGASGTPAASPAGAPTATAPATMAGRPQP